MSYHVPVMLDACIEGLRIQPEGIYVDATFGGGGHSREIAKKLQGGRLLAFDQDKDAAANAGTFDSRSFTFIAANFRYLKRFLKVHGVTHIDGLLADLGVSSHQINEPERGFSHRFDALLDMRMDTQTEQTARDIIHTYSEQDLHKVLGMYGELRNAKTLARAIVAARATGNIATTADLTAVLKKQVPRKVKENKYFSQVFQALRIEVNEELEALKELLEQAAEVLRPGGRLVVMSYHSLEDRLVKNYINQGKFFGEAERDLYGNVAKPLRGITRKPVMAAPEEVAANPRARSARLRIAEKIAQQK